MEITFFTFQAYVSHTTPAPLGWNHPHKERVHDCSHVGIKCTLVKRRWETKVLFVLCRKKDV